MVKEYKGPERRGKRGDHYYLRDRASGRSE